MRLLVKPKLLHLQEEKGIHDGSVAPAPVSEESAEQALDKDDPCQTVMKYARTIVAFWRVCRQEF